MAPEVRLVWITPEAERHIGYCARVSNPANQENPDVAGLLRYCIQNQHWSVFEMANMCVEIRTSRAITAQILRHRSFTYQEFSQRYAEVQSIEQIEFRRQDKKNRQNSTDDFSDDEKRQMKTVVGEYLDRSQRVYKYLLGAGVAKECARMVLPMASSSTIYMNGTVRSWIHYLGLRTGNGTQKEHKIIADAVKSIFIKELPIIAEALNWVGGCDEGAGS
jgi:thymidylate synthase (FAD)